MGVVEVVVIRDYMLTCFNNRPETQDREIALLSSIITHLPPLSHLEVDCSIHTDFIRYKYEGKAIYMNLFGA